MTFQLRIMTRELASALSACASVVDNATKIPILRTVRMTSDAGKLELVATNTMQTVIARAACEGSGSVCIDAQLLDVKVRALRQSEPVEFSQDGAFVVVSQGRTKWKVPILPAGDFPNQVAAPVKGKAIKVGDGFMAAVRQAATCAAVNQPARAYLEGVYLSDVVVATDGFGLALVDIGVKLPGVIMPIAAVKAITAMTGDVSVTASENAIQFDAEWMTIKTQSVEGNYPDYRRVIPSNSPGLVHVDRDGLRSAIVRASAIRADGEKAGAFVPVVLKIRDGEIEIHASNREGEEGSDFIACERLSGDDVDIRFSGANILRAVDGLACDSLAIAYDDHMSPVIMSPIKSDMENIRIAMPRRM